MKNNQNSSITNDNNQGPVVTQTAYSSLEDSFLEDSLKQEIQSLKKEVKSLKAQSRWNSGIIGLGVIGLIGYAIATNWSAFAAVGTATAAALPVIGIAVATIVAATVLVGVSYLAWRYRAEIKAGFKHAAEKTVEGAKYTAGKVKAGTVRAGNAVKKGYEHSVDSLKRGAKNAAGRLGGALQEFAHSGEHPIGSEFVQELLQQKGIKEVVNDTIKIAKADNSSVLPAIKSAMKSMIEYAIRLGTLGSADKDNLEKQMKVVDRLDKILTNSTLDTEEFNLVTTIFSKYQSKVKGILDDYKQHPENYPKEPTLSQRMSSSLRFKGDKKPGQTEVKYQVFPEGRSVGNSTFYINNPTYSADKTATVGKQPSGKQPIPVAPPQVPKNSDRSGSPDSGKGPSGSSTPTDRKSSPVESLQDELKEKLKNQFAPIEQPSVESVDQTTGKERK